MSWSSLEKIWRKTMNKLVVKLLRSSCSGYMCLCYLCRNLQIKRETLTHVIEDFSYWADLFCVIPHWLW